MIKIILFILICFFVFTSKNLSQENISNDKFYKFSGKIVQIIPDNSINSIGFKLKIDFEIKNISNQNLILWNRDAFDTMGESKIVRTIISKSNTFSEQDIITTNYWEPPDYYGKVWNDLRLSLDNETPSGNKTLLLQPNQSWAFSSDVKVYFRKKAVKTDKQNSPDNMQETQKVWVKFIYASWSPNIEPKEKYRATNLKFGKMLQKKWKPYGYLVINNLISDSISIDLTSGIINPRGYSDLFSL